MSVADVLIEKVQNFLKVLEVIPEEHMSTVTEFVFNYVTKNMLPMRESILQQMYPNGYSKDQESMAFHDVFTMNKFRDLRDVILVSQLSQIQQYSDVNE